MSDGYEHEDRGIRCPSCGCGHCPVLFTRPAPLERTRRRRQCRHCGEQFNTYEQVQGAGIKKGTDVYLSPES